ncbi:MAG: hypothetical protein WCI36_00380 [bacterium]
MNKKIVSEIAIGILLVVAILIGGAIYLQSNKVSQSTPNTAQQAQPAKTNTVQKTQPQKDTVQQPVALALENTYKNDKYSFTIKYPKNWKVSEKYGINFMPIEKNEEDFLPEKLNKEKDCAIGLSVLSAQKDISIFPCKTKLADITYGQSKFVKCFAVNVQDNSEGYSFRIIHPKLGNLIDIAPVADNTYCKSVIENMLGTLSFQ